MKALTVYQPWATLIIMGAKPYEFRGHRRCASIVGQRIVIHASARRVDESEIRALLAALNSEDPLDRAATCLHRETALEVLSSWQTLPLAAGIGTAVLGEPRLGADVAVDFGVDTANDSDRQAHSNWAWPMRDIERWDMPVPARGAQGLWTWPTPEAAGL